MAGVRRSDLSRIGFTAAAVATEEFVVFGNAESDVGIFMDLAYHIDNYVDYCYLIL